MALMLYIHNYIKHTDNHTKLVVYKRFLLHCVYTIVGKHLGKMNKVEFHNKILAIDRKEFELEHRIKEVRIIENLAIVVYDFDENAPTHRQFQNCKAFDENGKLVWTAEHPTNMTSDSYVEFMKENRIWNFGCFICELDFRNGKLKNTIFTK